MTDAWQKANEIFQAEIFSSKKRTRKSFVTNETKSVIQQNDVTDLPGFVYENRLYFSSAPRQLTAVFPFSPTPV